MPRKCKNCPNKGPSFNFPGVTPGIYCSKCALEGMINVKIKRCVTPECTKPARYGLIGEKASHCIDHKTPQMTNAKDKKCIAKNEDGSPCMTRATFNLPGKKGRQYCSKHKTAEMIDVVHKKCIKCGTARPSYGTRDSGALLYCSGCVNRHKIEDVIDLAHKSCQHTEDGKQCEKFPCFNLPHLNKGLYCAQHKLPDMIDVVNSRCKYAGCNTRPSYSDDGTGTPLYCQLHALPHMINTKKKCAEEGCMVLPSHNLPGEKALYCAEHKKAGMINVRSKVCEADGCTTLATFNRPEIRTPVFCAKHAAPDMVCVTIQRCAEEGCEITININCSYGFPGYQATHCKAHKQDGMIQGPRRMCHPDNGEKCKNHALYGFNKTSHCEEHKLDGEFNLIEKPCKNCALLDVLDSEQLCCSCNPVMVRRARLAKQREVELFLKGNNLTPKQIDRTIDYGTCGKERPDFLWDCTTHYLIVEVDENQHNGRQCECEQTRMVNISQTLGGPPVWFIRYNPDEYKKKGGRKRVKGDTAKKRHEKLKEWIVYCMKTEPPDFINAVYLYFDEWDGTAVEETILEYEI